MRRSIFITFLFVSLCYTAPPDVTTKNSPHDGTNEPSPLSTTQKNTPIKDSTAETSIVSPNTTVKVEGEIKHVLSIDTPANVTETPADKVTTIMPPSTSSDTATTNKAPTTPEPPTTSSTVAPTTTKPTTESPTTTVTPAPPTTKPTTPKPVPTTTVPPHTSSTPSNVTSAPIVTTTATPAKGRTFDGASFLGGMILSFGIVAIGIMGFRYYKSHSEQNYHTL